MEKDHKMTEPIPTTTHCLNCQKAHRGECESYSKLSTQLFAERMELDDRINEYKKLAMKLGCEI